MVVGATTGHAASTHAAPGAPRLILACAARHRLRMAAPPGHDLRRASHSGGRPDDHLPQ
jgi:hypothetical protein